MRPVSAVLFGSDIPIPSDIDLGFLAGQTLAIYDAGGGTFAVKKHTAEHALADAQVVGQQLHLPAPTMAALKWESGQVFSILRGDNQSILLQPIEPAQHLDFHSPVFGVDGLPIPPHFLIQAFTNSVEIRPLIENGKLAAEFVIRKAAEHGKPLQPGNTFLDFGCGSGRVLRHIPQLTGAGVIGTDLYKPAIEWCRRHYPFGKFMDGILQPPLALEDDSVDAMLALSVLTHLNYENCGAWLREWKRIMKPGSIAAVSFHGDGFVDAAFSEDLPGRAYIEANLAKNDGVAFMDNKAWQGIFPDEYQTTYHTFEHVRREWGKIFEIVEILPSGSFVNRQDVAIMRA